MSAEQLAGGALGDAELAEIGVGPEARRAFADAFGPVDGPEA